MPRLTRAPGCGVGARAAGAATIVLPLAALALAATGGATRASSPRPARAPRSPAHQTGSRSPGGSDACAHVDVGLVGASPVRTAGFDVRVDPRSRSGSPAGAHGPAVSVRRGARRGAFSLARDVDPPWAACVRVADARPRGDTTYVLLLAEGDSRAQPAEGECAGGGEAKLLWYAFGPTAGPRLVPVRRQAVAINSCLDAVESDDDPDFTGDTLRVRATRSRGGEQNLVIRYDRRAPERGIVVTPADGTAR